MTHEEAISLLHDRDKYGQPMRANLLNYCVHDDHIFANATRVRRRRKHGGQGYTAGARVHFDGRVLKHYGRLWKRIARGLQATLRRARRGGVDFAEVSRALGAGELEVVPTAETIEADGRELHHLAVAMADNGAMCVTESAIFGQGETQHRVWIKLRGMEIGLAASRCHDGRVEARIIANNTGALSHLRKEPVGFAPAQTVTQAVRAAVGALESDVRHIRWHSGGNSYRTGMTHGARRWLRDLARRVPPDRASR